MVHQPSRRALALALRRYAAKRCTNYQLDDVEIDWRDRGADAVKEQAWFLYDDIGRHRAVGRHALNREARRTIARWVVFLRSDQEYLWPDYSSFGLLSLILSILTAGWWGRREKRRWAEFTAAGDIDAWPFIDKQAEMSARAKPTYLAGST